MMKQPTTSPGETTPEPRIAPPSVKGSIDNATLDLLAKWRTEDATTNPEDVLASEKELAEFKRAMNESRTDSGETLLYP
jgi:hypothetical protein